MSSMDTVFDKSIVDTSDFDAMFDSEGSLIEMVAGYNEDGNPVTGADFDDLHLEDDPDTKPNDVRNGLGADQELQGAKNVEGSYKNDVGDNSIGSKDHDQAVVDKELDLGSDRDSDFINDKDSGTTPKDGDNVTDAIESELKEAMDLFAFDLDAMMEADNLDLEDDPETNRQEGNPDYKLGDKNNPLEGGSVTVDAELDNGGDDDSDTDSTDECSGSSCGGGSDLDKDLDEGGDASADGDNIDKELDGGNDEDNSEDDPVAEAFGSFDESDVEDAVANDDDPDQDDVDVVDANGEASTPNLDYDYGDDELIDMVK